MKHTVRQITREQARLERLPLAPWTEEFQQEFCETMQWPPARLGRVDEFRKGRSWSMRFRERTPSPSVAEDVE